MATLEWLTARRFTWLDLLVVVAIHPLSGWKFVAAAFGLVFLSGFVDGRVRKASKHPSADQQKGGE